MTKKCRYVVALGATATSAVHGKYCRKLVVVGEPFFKGGLSFVLPRRSNWTSIMSKATMRLRESDSIPTIQDYVEREGRCDVGVSHTLAFDKLMWFFICAFGAAGVVFLVMVVDPRKPLPRESQDTNQTVTMSNEEARQQQILDAASKVSESERISTASMDDIVPADHSTSSSE